MATRVIDEFGSRANPPDAAYPDGSLKDETNPGVSNDGSPLSSRIGNDFQGFMQSTLAEAGIDANGNPDSVDNPQILNALKKVQENHASAYTSIDYKASGGKSAFENMGDGNPVAAKLNEIVKCENGTAFKRVSNNGDVTDFRIFGDVNILDFGSDHTSALRAACSELVRNGGGVINQTSDLTLLLNPEETVWDGADSKHIGWRSNGFTIYDQTSYLDGQVSTLIFAKNVKSIDVDLNVDTQHSIIPGIPTLVPKLGMQAIKIEDNCKGGKVKVNQVGGYSACNFGIPAGATLPIENHSSGFYVDIHTNYTHYPFRSTFNGMNIRGTLRTENSGRPFYMYDAHNIELDIYTKNVFKTALIAAFGGKGCSNIELKVEDIDSDFATPSTPYLAIRYGDITPANMINIDLTFKLESKLTDGYDFGFEIGKYNNVAPDPLGRGHRLEGVTLRGDINLSTPNGIPVTSVGDWEEGVDVQRNVNIEGLRCIGQSSTLNIKALRGSSFLRGVDARAGADNFYVQSNSNSNVTFIGCRAAQFYKPTELTFKQTFIDCEMTATEATQVRNNKTLVNTVLSDGLAESYYRNGAGVVRNKVQYKGSLVTPLELTVLPKGQYQVTVNYYVVRDRTDTNPSTRDESLGVYTCSVVVGSDGSFNAIQDWNQDSDRTINTPPALVFTGVDVGDESSIRVSSVAYNNVNTTSVFEISVKDNDLEATL